MDGNALHGRNDDPLDVSARVARVVHGRVPAVLRVIFVAMLGASPDVVEVLPVGIDELDGGAVAVHVDDCPQRAPCLHAAEEHALFLPVHAKVHVSGGGDVVEEHRIPFGEPLGHGLRPVAWFVREVRAGVPWKAISQVDRVVAGETEPDHAAPVVRDLEEFDTDLFANANGSSAERDAPAEAFVSSGDGSAIAESDIFTVNMMEHQRWQIVRARAG